MELLLSKKQIETLEDFFSGEYRDILYGGGARGGKSWLIGVLLAICISAMPGSTWLVARTVLSDLKGTTLATFFQVLKKLGFGENSYRDKIRDEKAIYFNNGSKVIVMQVNNEPSDPEFDRLGSYSLTGAFLDEGQQMVSKVRSVLKGRFSETSGDFKFKVDKPKKGKIDYDNLGYNIKIKIVGQACLDERDIDIEYEEIIQEGKYYCAITGYYDLFIPYKIVNKEDKGDYLLLTAVWQFKSVTLISCNPGKNFTYTDFYKPYTKGLAEGDAQKYMPRRKFIKALVNDNPFVDKSYIEGLMDADEVTKQRLLYGNFEYDDDPTLLFDIDLLMSAFEGNMPMEGHTYICIDAARQGKDTTVIGIWKGLTLFEMEVIEKGNLMDQARVIEELIKKYNVDIDNVIVDEVGVGGGLVDILGCKGFIANASAIHPYSSKLLSYKKRNYANLRTQAFFYVQKYMREGKIKIKCNETLKETIIEELGFIKQNSVDDDRKIALESKADMKALLGRSPDIADMISFRMWWIIKAHYEGDISEEDELEEEEDEIERLEKLYNNQNNLDNSSEYSNIDVDIYD